jgi:hypothetical protein
MRKKYAPKHEIIRDSFYYYVRHIPCDLAPIYSVTRLCFSLKTKSLKAAIRTSKSVTQRLEDYWLGLRIQNMDIPAIQVGRASDEANGCNFTLQVNNRDHLMRSFCLMVQQLQTIFSRLLMVCL